MFCTAALAAITLAHIHSASLPEIAVYYPPHHKLSEMNGVALTSRAGYLVVAPAKFFARD
jgi:hypothetical protein